MREVAHVLEMMQRTAPEKRITLWNDVGTSILPTHLSRPNILNTYHLYNDARCIAKRCSQKFDRHSERHSLPIACQNFTSCQMTREISASMLGLARHKKQSCNTKQTVLFAGGFNKFQKYVLTASVDLYTHFNKRRLQRTQPHGPYFSKNSV